MVGGGAVNDIATHIGVGEPVGGRERDVQLPQGAEEARHIAITDGRDVAAVCVPLYTSALHSQQTANGDGMTLGLVDGLVHSSSLIFPALHHPATHRAFPHLLHSLADFTLSPCALRLIFIEPRAGTARPDLLVRELGVGLLGGLWA